jgi:molybdopterin synthase sulfur carrier subunit
MQLTVRLFARAKDLVGSDTATVQLPDSAVVADLKSALKEQYPQLAPLVAHLHIAIGTNYATDRTPLSAQDAVTCFPPVSGG